MSQLITDPAEFNDWLREISSHVPWDAFSVRNNGTIELQGIPFKLRVGLHMKRPMRAIIAVNQFIRVKAAPEFKDYQLKKLTPEAPDTCMYTDLSTSRIGVFACWSPGGLVEAPEERSEFQDSLILDYASTVNKMLARGTK
jgi:hypothetical protein